jgi:hypothetical protein
MNKLIEPKLINDQWATSIEIWQTFNSMELNVDIGGHALIQYTILTSLGSSITSGHIRLDGETYTIWTGDYQYAADYIAAELDIAFLSE